MTPEERFDMEPEIITNERGDVAVVHRDVVSMKAQVGL